RRQARFADIHACVRQMSLVQIDTINVVARSPYLVLFSRLGAFPAEWLEQTLAAGALFEYWAHEACFIPFEDYPLL
ncbi:DNA glycosylase AlkZ-like family protein, partial [Klebsiella pneumoniae]|uniref:DNA glycosylase AlkZ-like family protein n=1 Tax=Klebsiella pneumoniae TaxID=573 RepID=UPI003B5BB9B5